MQRSRFRTQDTSQKTDDWLEKYNQETVLFQSQLDKLKSARAMDLATYQKIAADVSGAQFDITYETSLVARASSRCTSKSCETIALQKNVVVGNSNVSNYSCTLLSKYNHGGVECSFVIPSGRIRRRRRKARRRNRKHCASALPFVVRSHNPSLFCEINRLHQARLSSLPNNESVISDRSTEWQCKSLSIASFHTDLMETLNERAIPAEAKVDG